MSLEPRNLQRRPADRRRHLVDFDRDARRWRTVDDTVMGGRSWSALVASSGRSALFLGELSPAGGGGFALARSDKSLHDLSGNTGVRIRLRGDGNRYELRLRVDGDPPGVWYRAPLATFPMKWMEHELPFDSFEPVLRGRPLAEHPPLDPSRISSVGLLVAGRQAGPFRLEVAWVDAF